jgi:hypothetical protein
VQKIGSRRVVLALITIFGVGCGSDKPAALSGVGTPPAAGSTAPTAAGSAAGTAAVSGTAGTAPTASAGTRAVAGRGASGTGAAGATPGQGAPPPSAGGSTAGAAAPAAGSGTPAAGSGALAGAGAPPASTAGKLPRVTTTDGVGPFKEVVKVKNTPPGGWLIYPKDIGRDGIKHPLFIFGPGGGTTPDTYEQMGMHWDRYGSYGFVIYVLPMSTGDGAPMKAGLDWLIKQNDDMSSPLYQKLDTTKVCAAGHSQGSITTFAFMPDDRVTTTIHISGGSFDGMGPSKLKSDTMFLCGPDGSADVAEPQCETDFANTKVPTYYTKIQGATHLTSGRLGWAAVIAWMLWHLADQGDQWKKEFLEPTGQFQMGIYKSQVKNWQ